MRNWLWIRDTFKRHRDTYVSGVLQAIEEDVNGKVAKSEPEASVKALATSKGKSSRVQTFFFAGAADGEKVAKSLNFYPEA